ncbi:MAG: methyltransferase FkbM family, partial [Bacteriovoracaceae bacterium]|nr:methyltransferase FkbM family [Bacteriovoracaceae bacterium]
QIVQKAVSDIPGQIVPFYVSSEHFGIHSLKPFHSSHQPKIEVETVRLDETLDKLNIQNVSFLKVDIEGADLLALKSFDFNRFRPPVVMCEFMDARTQLHFGYTHHDIVNFMSNFGYSTYVSEWSPVLEYGRKGETTSSFQELVRFLPWKPDLSPVWGNLIFVPHSEAKALELCYRRLVSKVKLLSSLRSVPFLRKAYQMTKRIIQKRN